LYSCETRVCIDDVAALDPDDMRLAHLQLGRFLDRYDALTRVDRARERVAAGRLAGARRARDDDDAQR